MTKSEQLKRDAEFEITHPNDPDYGKKAYLFRMGKLEEYINAVIAERMPSRDCENRELDRRKRYDEAMGYTFNEIKSLEKGIKFGMRFYKRLLTNSSQKTEGGGE